ncbi:helix-turn-helix domain-containing protein [Musicola paradisiaca]|uniref:Transcriptional regulator, AraC family n=1 Tax=Musicola paradisiaca (strain Ech703) TaxID=579405 RepID=C6CDD4_MUSP7|nr:AraC family transcriptional regulator [Musicola paradisiaca]ACS87005.1 transcriptional regulator, AraC family [Musicola paradisiaca Ech703]
MHHCSMSLSVRPLQPWFVINAAEEYLKKNLDNSPIAHFYSFSVAREQPVTLAVPDGSVDLLFHCNQDEPGGRVCGSTVSAQATRLLPGERYFGVRFMPGVMPAFLDLSPGELAGQEIPFQDVAPGAARLLARLVRSRDFSEQITLFLHYFAHWTNRASSPLLLQIIDLIMAHDGMIRVEDLERKTLYSARYIHRLFHDHCGMSPKAFCRTIRFQRALSLLNHGDVESLAQLAQRLGYADQSHFLREFKQFASCSPKRYLAGLQAVRYQHRIRQC